MKNKKELKKIFISILTFVIISLGMSYYMNIKTNALENEKVKVTEKEQKYEGDCVDENVALSDDIVIKIIEKVDSSLDINFVNKFDEIDENNKPYTSIELSVSGNLDKIKENNNTFIEGEIIILPFTNKLRLYSKSLNQCNYDINKYEIAYKNYFINFNNPDKIYKNYYELFNQYEIDTTFNNIMFYKIYRYYGGKLWLQII